MTTVGIVRHDHGRGDHLLPVRTRRRLLTRIPPVQPPTEPARLPGDYGVAEPDELRLEAEAA